MKKAKSPINTTKFECIESSDLSYLKQGIRIIDAPNFEGIPTFHTSRQFSSPPSNRAPVRNNIKKHLNSFRTVTVTLGKSIIHHPYLKICSVNIE